MSFFATLLSSEGPTHLYRVHLDGGERLAHLTLDTEAGEIVSAAEDGTPTGALRVFLEDGELEPMADQEAEGEAREENGHISREEFSWISVHLRAQYLRTGTAPGKVSKTYG
ncbi:hypothetical protein [Streptomyces avicenniae]|uniref:hypothetical protein n=1 Tax=Streptomyces avicenniae TaxID=500153 RepID=UPI00167C9339|nr:hypothetical protein [Streptomyces avicenniae]